MNTLTQYGMMAEKHWREHCPNLVRELEARGQLQAMLADAEQKTKDEMATLRLDLMKQGKTAAPGPRQRVGNRAGAIHPAATGNGSGSSLSEDSPKNLNNYRITDDDRLGAGGPKQKFQQNLRAIQLVGKLASEGRPATPDEKAVLIKYVGWGAMPQVFDAKNKEWANERKALRAELAE